MSFEMKYDKNGIPIKQAEQEQPQPQEIEPENQPPTEEKQQEPQVSEEEQQQAEKARVKEENFARLREKTNKLEQERDEAIRYAREVQAKYTPVQQAAQEEDYKLNPDDLVEAKHLSKYDRKIKKLEDENRQYQQRMSETMAEAQIKSRYSDFDKIVSKENIEALKETEPEIAAAIHNTQDFYKKASLAYKMIKKLGIAQEDNYKKDRDIAQKNSMKPKPVNTISPQQGNTPLSKANAFAEGLTDELKAQLRREMADARKNM